MAEDSKATASGTDKKPSGAYAGTEVTIEGEEHLILREDEIQVVADSE
ncbi:hypothetical protein [Kitasatospora sp. NPDC001225]